MIRVKVMGGFGNQLFQYAFARNIQIKYGYDVEIVTSWYQNMGEATPRAFLLDKVYSNIIIADNSGTNRCKNIKIESDEFDGVIDDDTYYIGYWQDPVYFNEIKDTLKNEFSIKNKRTAELIEIYMSRLLEKNSTSIHVRRGDYLLNSNHPLCDLEYYNKAIELIGNKYDNVIYYIFSDDIDWCVDNLFFSKDKAVFINTGDDIADWYLMSKANHHIIANSTFSWWAAWIDYSGKETVIMPKKWLKSDDCRKLKCEGWIRI